MNRDPPADWTKGPARWAAAAILGLAAIAGLAFSIATGRWPLDPSRAPWAAYPTSPRSPVVDRVPSRDDATALPTAVAGRINVNAASAPELELLPGIGPTLARRIVEVRQRDGPFRSLDELSRVPGIGPKTIERLSSLAIAAPADAHATTRPAPTTTPDDHTPP